MKVEENEGKREREGEGETKELVEIRKEKVRISARKEGRGENGWVNLSQPSAVCPPAKNNQPARRAWDCLW